jgi:hypothetical protein
MPTMRIETPLRVLDRTSGQEVVVYRIKDPSLSA